MAMSCDPCDCPEQHYRDKQTWRKAVITLLCRMINLITTLTTNIAALAQGQGQGNGDPVPLFAWSASEQVWPFELADDGSILYARLYTTTGWTGNVFTWALPTSEEVNVFRIWGDMSSGTEMIPFNRTDSPYTSLDVINNEIRIFAASGAMPGRDVRIFVIYKK